MASFQLSDLQASLEVVVFSRSYEQMGTKLSEGTTVVVEGKIDASDGRLRLLASAVHDLDELKEKPLSPSANGKRSGRSEPGAARAGNGASTVSSDLPARRISIELHRGPDRAGDVERIVAAYQLMQRFHGQDEVEILLRHGTRLTAIPLPNKLVGYCTELAAELVRVLHGATVRVDGEPVSV